MLIAAFDTQIAGAAAQVRARARDLALLGETVEEAAVDVVRVPMAASEQRAVDLMQPSHRNMNGFIFGFQRRVW